MNDKDTIEQLREQLKRVTEERDQLQKTVLRLVADQIPLQSEEEVAREIEEIRRNPIPFDEKLLEEIRNRLGLAS
jgi:hypothetical protein